MNKRFPIGRVALATVNTLICIFLLAPIVVVIGASFTATNYYAFPPQGLSLRWYEQVFQSTAVTDAAVVTLQVALLATAIAMLIGVPASIALSRTELVGRGFFNGVLLAPLLVPAIVLGIGMLIFFSRMRLTGTVHGLVLAHTVTVLPYVIIVVTAGLQAVDRSPEAAARSLGATPLRAFWDVTLPALRPSLTAAAMFAFITSIDETVVTLFLVGPGTTTLPVTIFNYIQYNSDPMPAALATVLIVVTIVFLVVIDLLVGIRRVTVTEGGKA